MTDTQRSLFCFGLGYSALQLARRLSGAGWKVGGTVRSEDKARRLQDSGVAAQVFDGEGSVQPPAGSDWVISIPPTGDGCPAFAAAADSASSANSITYLSTTGVYGDLGGGWAFEWSRLNPRNARSENRVRAERQWSGAGARLSIVRLPGIYGPGRSALDRVRAGTARRIVKDGQVFSRVHVDDIATGLEAILMCDASGVFHLTDDEPAPPQDVIAYAASLLGTGAPPEVAFDEAGLSPMARSFYGECKRVSNARAKAALGWRPRFPTYREGLAAILAGGH